MAVIHIAIPSATVRIADDNRKLYTTRQMPAASWGKPEACQHTKVLFCARDYNIGTYLAG